MLHAMQTPKPERRPFDSELETYARHKDELLARAEGQWVLIKDDAVIGTYPDFVTACRAGYERFGRVPVLVKRIERVEKRLWILAASA
jgi:hypothetical protein